MKGTKALLAQHHVYAQCLDMDFNPTAIGGYFSLERKRHRVIQIIHFTLLRFSSNQCGLINLLTDAPIVAPSVIATCPTLKLAANCLHLYYPNRIQIGSFMHDRLTFQNSTRHIDIYKPELHARTTRNRSGDG